MTTTEEEEKELKKLKFIQSEVLTEAGSVFTARCTKVENMQDVHKAYKAILSDPKNLASTHNCVGYVLPNGDSGYCDDKDYGIGRTIVSAVNDTDASGYAVFLTRQYGGTKLGYKRFHIAYDLARQVLPTKTTGSYLPFENHASDYKHPYVISYEGKDKEQRGQERYRGRGRGRGSRGGRGSGCGG